MFRDPLIRKAWTLCKETAQCPTEILLKAAIWLEENYQQTPDGNTAMVIALHYLMLAMRQGPGVTAEITEVYVSRATHWREEAIRCLSTDAVLLCGRAVCLKAVKGDSSKAR